MYYPCAAIFKLKRNIQEITHCPANSILPFRLHIEHKETAAASTKKFSTQRPCCNTFGIEFINAVSRNC